MSLKHPAHGAYPCSATSRYQRTASASSFGTPRPLAYMFPRLYCALSLPCSAANPDHGITSTPPLGTPSPVRYSARAGFVEQEFRECLQCGALGTGFGRFCCAEWVSTRARHQMPACGTSVSAPEDDRILRLLPVSSSVGSSSRSSAAGRSPSQTHSLLKFSTTPILWS